MSEWSFDGNEITRIHLQERNDNRQLIALIPSLKFEELPTNKHDPVHVSRLKVIGGNTLFQYRFFSRQVDYAAECSDFKDDIIGNKTLRNRDLEQTG